ncbi:MAG: hypothetical protein GXO70_03250 [Acidobacteria bacterium]|nr:hypothetical protein [Acidobacteriota bacterium]
MKRIIIFIIFLVSSVFGNSLAQGLVVDHTCTDVSRIPQTYIDQAKTALRVGYSHTSHGSQLVTGINAFKGNPGDEFYFESTDWGLNPGVFLNDYWGNDAGASDLGHNGDLSWRDATITMLSKPDNDRNVVIWSWCGGAGDNTASGIDTYLNAMNELEQQYPNVIFVYMTGHLEGTGLEGNLHQMNERIRDYCRAHSKILYDFADIESYDPDGTTNFNELYATDGCEYDTDGDHNPWGDGNWATEWISANPSSELAQIAASCSECAHSETLNCVLKGHGFWWLMARLAGWQGTSAQVVIDRFTADRSSGTAPLQVNFTCVAHSSGRSIAQYRWDLTGGQPDSIVTTVGRLSYRFLIPGSYAVKVTATDNGGDSGSAELGTGSGADVISVSGFSPMAMPLPGRLQINKLAKDSGSTIQTVAVNVFDQSTSVTLEAKDSSGQVLATASVPVSSNGSAVLSSDSFDGLAVDMIDATCDRNLLLFCRITTDTARMTAELSTCLSSPLYVPHIAEEVNYWDTYAYLSNTDPRMLDVMVAGQTASGTAALSGIVDLEALLPEDVAVADAWGKLTAYETDPATGIRSLSGFEMFVKTGNDGAATELVGEGSTTLYIPHVPEETDIFWTGFALLNTTSGEADVTATFYDDNGAVVGTESLTIPAQSKIKGLMTDLFPDEAGIARWGILQSTKPITGIEIYGTYNAGICGLALPAVANTWGVLPDVLTGEENWTGIAITNTGAAEATVTIRLVRADGAIRSGRTEHITAMHRFKAVVVDYFSTVTPQPGDTVRYISDQPIIALEASGDLDRTFMTALTGTR